MKIYAIMLDSSPPTKELKKVFKSKNIHYTDNYITNCFTAATLVPMLSGQSPSEMDNMGISHENAYPSLSSEKREIWDKKIIFNMLPGDWNIHLHAIPSTRRDGETYMGISNYKFLPNELCGINRPYNLYDYRAGEDEEEFVKRMQDLNKDENHFIFIKYNHYLDTDDRCSGDDKECISNMRDKEKNAMKTFIDIVKNIDFEEENSLFWLFSDHLRYTFIDSLITPPAPFTWCSVTDNITNKKVIKKIIHCQDFFNTVMNRIYNKNLPNDVLDKLDKDRIYVVEDGRQKIDAYKSTTVSAIKYLGDNIFIQLSYHSPKKQMRTIVRNNNFDEKFEYFGSDLYFEVPTNKELLKYLKSGIWSWYFNDLQ